MPEDVIIEDVSFGEIYDVTEIDGIPVQHDNRRGSYATGFFSMKEEYFGDPEEDEEGYVTWQEGPAYAEHGVHFCNCERVATIPDDSSVPFIWHEQECHLEYRNEFAEDWLLFL